MGNDLDSAAQVVTTAFFLDNILVDPAGSKIIAPGHAGTHEALIMSQVQVGFRSILRDINLTVLERAHGARVDVDIRVQFQQGHVQPAGFENGPQGSRGDPFPQGRDHATGDKYKPRQGINPHFSPGRLLSPDICLLSMSSYKFFTISPLHTALDAFIAPFLGRNPAGGCRRANRLSCRFVSLVFFPPAGTYFLNQKANYAFGRRHPQAEKIGAIIASPDEKYGLSPGGKVRKRQPAPACRYRLRASVVIRP